VAPVLLLISVLTSIALFFPNTQQIMCNHEISTDPPPQNSGRFGWVWQPSPRWAMATWLLLAISMGLMAGETTFVYYQF
jgi:hypothetical protein